MNRNEEKYYTAVIDKAVEEKVEYFLFGDLRKGVFALHVLNAP
jgi:hypothetical protein